MTPPTLLRLAALPLAMAHATLAAAQTDRVRLVEGGSEAGQIVATSPDGVTLRSGGRERMIPVVEIKSVLFGEEPAELAQARINTRNGGYETALEKLRNVSLRDIERDLVKQEVKFYVAYCDARLAAVGQGDAGVSGRRLNGFLREYRDSFHHYEALEALGDLLASVERYEPAGKMYDRIAEAPFPSLKMRSGVLAGRALAAQGKHRQAIDRFDRAAAVVADGAAAESQRLAARLGKAASLAADGQLDAGLKLTRSVLSAADEQDAALQAAAYNTLGRCYDAAGEKLDALFAYLHTDLLFSGDPATHAEALSRLATLWRDIGKPDEARDALARLRRQYAASKWAREAG